MDNPIKKKVCDMCAAHNHLVKDYAEDFDLQTAIRNYLENTWGERLNVADIAKLCESCYDKVRNGSSEDEDDE